MVAVAIEGAHRRTARESATFTESGLRTFRHVRIALEKGGDIVQIPPQCKVKEMEGGRGGRSGVGAVFRG